MGCEFKIHTPARVSGCKGPFLLCTLFILPVYSEEFETFQILEIKPVSTDCLTFRRLYARAEWKRQEHRNEGWFL
jgi:hypothetical protein